MSDLTLEERVLLKEFIEKRAEIIIATQSSKGIRASGASADMLRENLEDNIVQLIDGSGYFEFQEFGRRAGKAPPFQKLYEWLAFQKYGKSWTNDKQRRGIAWALQRKIRDKGTHTHITGRPTGVLTESLNEQALRELMNALTKAKVRGVTNAVKRNFN
jgi:hypothetical protein